MSYIETQKTIHDELIGGTAVPLLVKNVTLKGVSETLKRGTLLAINAGKYEIVDTESGTAEVKVADAVLAEDVILTGSDAVATVYISGMFNVSKLIVKSGSDSADKHEAELRKVGIYLTNLL